MAVEVLRRCYKSEWFLFRDAPDVGTPGAYYFNDDAPAYEGFHYYGSRNWYPESHEINQGLGERLDIDQPWIEGNPPAWQAIASAVGTRECIESGALIADAIDYANTFDGIIEACVFKEDPEDVLWRKLSDFNNCNVQRMYSFVLIAMTNDDAAAVDDVLRAFLGPGPVISFRKSNGVFNGVTTVTSLTWQLVIVDGTRNAQQFALQAFSVPLGPLDFGGLSTNPFWFAASTICMQKMVDDGQLPAMRIMCVGHSYGGVVALLSAARNRQADAARKIAFLTFGCPKIGDRRLVDLVQSCNGVNISNEGDLITVLPPDRYLLAPLIPLFPLVPIYLWANWERPKPQVLLKPDGTILLNVPTPMDTATILALVTLMLTDRSPDPFAPHYVLTYNGRLFARCPDCCFPCTDPVCEEVILTNPVLAFTRPPVPKSGLIWQPGEKIPLAANICATAYDVDFGEYASIIPGTIGQLWFRVPVPDATLIHLRVHTDEIGGIALNAFWGPNCSSLTGFGVLFPSPYSCIARTTITDGFFWFRFASPAAEGWFIVDVGPCP